MIMVMDILEFKDMSSHITEVNADVGICVLHSLIHANESESVNFFRIP